MKVVMSETPAPLADRAVSIRDMLSARRDEPPVSRGTFGYGFAIVGVFFGLFGATAVLAPLDSSAIAPGVISPQGKQQAVQHLEGGIVSAIHVKEGSHASAGDPLVTLDGTKAETIRSILRGRLIAARALAARLRAERDGIDGVNFDFDERESRAPEVLDAMAGQLGIFESRRDALESQGKILNRRLAQLESEIDGLRDQMNAQARQAELVSKEIAGVAALVEKGLERQPRLLALQRTQAEIDKAQALASASIARGQQRIGETSLQIQDLRIRFLSEVVAELREVDDEILDYQERLRDAETTLERTRIVAGVDGVVVGLNVFTVGGVIGPGERIISLVPDNDRLIVEARVNPNDIDVVRTGLSARVRLTAFSQRSVDMIPGEVITVSADRLTDPATNIPYYLAKIRLDESALSGGLAEQTTPGMGAEVMIRTGERTLFEYLIKPLSDSMQRALTED